jgi:hypothetical protein
VDPLDKQTGIPRGAREQITFQLITFFSQKMTN